MSAWCRCICLQISGLLLSSVDLYADSVPSEIIDHVLICAFVLSFSSISHFPGSKVFKRSAVVLMDGG